jgi:tetratricopeptide (TPR) repeat protein
MKKVAFYNAAFLTAFLYIQFPHYSISSSKKILDGYKTRNTISCAPDRGDLAKLLVDADIPLMPGSGSYVWKIDTKSDSAQLYFNQGINTYYGFHIIESLASFKKAAKFDPDNAMVWWAQALAFGPNINDVGYNASPEALDAVRKSVELSENVKPVEKALINAMRLRYSEDTTTNREILNQAYTDGMRAAYALFPGDGDIAALYADAMMLQHPWDLWYPNGTPKQWTPGIREVLEKALAKDSMHPGLNHYYIHVMEPSPYAAMATRSADVLGSITPGLAHLVHMPSHIYLRTGRFNRGTAINEQAVARFKEYSTLFPEVANGAFIYLLHNQHMLINCAMLAGRYETSIAAASELQQMIDSATLAVPPPLGSLVQYVYMTPALVQIRFEKWDLLLQMSKPDDKLVYANILYHFGRGMAQAGKNNLAAAEKESEQMMALMKNEDLKIPMTPFSAAIESAITASEMLKGFIALQKKSPDEAIAHFSRAAETESKMVYNEPRDWILNPWQYLGSACLIKKDYAKAEEAFKNDLKVNNKNVWSLNRLGAVYGARAKRAEAEAAQKDFKDASSQSDIDFRKLFF